MWTDDRKRNKNLYFKKKIIVIMHRREKEQSSVFPEENDHDNDGNMKNHHNCLAHLDSIIDILLKIIKNESSVHFKIIIKLTHQSKSPWHLIILTKLSVLFLENTQWIQFPWNFTMPPNNHKQSSYLSLFSKSTDSSKI